MAGGPRVHVEYWIPAEELNEFSSHIVGEIRVIRAFRGDPPVGVAVRAEVVTVRTLLHTHQITPAMRHSEGNCKPSRAVRRCPVLPKAPQVRRSRHVR